MNRAQDRDDLLAFLESEYGPVQHDPASPWAFAIRSEPLRQFVLEHGFADSATLGEVIDLARPMDARGCWIVDNQGHLRNANAL